MSDLQPGLYAEWVDGALLSPSTAHEIVSRSPLHGWFSKFGGAPQEYTDATDLGQLAHALILGGAEIVQVDAKDWRTKAAQEARDAARAQFKIPVLTHKLQEVSKLVEYVGAFLRERDLALSGLSEQSAVWKERGLDVWCHGRLDHWLEDSATIIDLKFVSNASPGAAARQCINLGYDLKAAAYTSAIEHIFPDLAGRVRFLWLFAEVDPPYALTLARPGGVMRALGQAKWMRACETWKRCLADYGTEKPWPSYTSEVVDLLAPEWAMKQEVEVGEALEIEL